MSRPRLTRIVAAMPASRRRASNRSAPAGLGGGVEAQHLFDDLTRVEIAVEAELARNAEDAAHGAAGLGADTHRLASCACLHLDRLDVLTIVQAQQQLGRQSIH